MRRRLRKKLRRGEFQELGFDLGAELRADLDAASHNGLAERFIAFVESRDLTFGGGFGPDRIEGFVARRSRASATDEDRAALERFLGSASEVYRVSTGPLRDAYR